MSASEAVDLIETLPMGSLWRADCSVAAEWSEERYLLTRILNLLTIMAYGRRYEGDPELTEFPLEREARLSQVRKAREVRDKLNNTKWKEVKTNG